ncbi:MAG: serine hydrolase [Erythrobacter sp.]|nr:serine hydrolase [Erythrobacter sp.]
MMARKWVVAFTASLLAGPATAAEPKAAGCEAALAYSATRNGEAVLVLKNGQVICASKRVGVAHELWSGTKSLVGLMAAAAVQDGLMSLDEPASATITEWEKDPAKRTITLRQLLSMTSGHPSEIGRPQGYRASLSVKTVTPPGASFQYGPTPLQIFGEVMQRKLRAAGQDANPRRYLERRVLLPLGVKVVEWRNGPDGNPLMPQGAKMSAEEWAKVGEFVRGGGILDGRPLVDPGTFKALFEGSKANPAYGLTWWLPRASALADPATAATDITDPDAGLPSDMVVAAGAGDQRLYVIPSQGLTIVRQARLDLVALMARRKTDWSDQRFLSFFLAQELAS